MIKTKVRVDGMMCGMCEAHINGAVRAAFSVKKVSSSHARGETVILSEQPLDEVRLRAVIDGTGYRAVSVEAAEYQKKGLFARFQK